MGIGKTNRTMSAVNATEAAISGAAWAAAQMGPIPFAPETNLWLSKSWRWLFETYPDWMILTVGTYIVHEVVFFGRWLPYVVFDRVAACRKYKIQEDKVTSPADIRKAVLPHWWTICYSMVVCLVVEDAWEYWGHRALHWGPLYKHVHKMHHEYQAPFGIVAEYAHPVETVILGIGTMLGPFILAFNEFHLVTLWCWLTVRLLQTVDAHSGYDFPWSMRNFLPFWAGADFHDHHHKVFRGNYATSFRWWDWLCNTDRRYRAEQVRRDHLLRNLNKESTLENSTIHAVTKPPKRGRLRKIK